MLFIINILYAIGKPLIRTRDNRNGLFFLVLCAKAMKVEKPLNT